MLKFPLWSLLILAFYANPAAASCDYLILGGIDELRECVKTQQFTLSNQASLIRILNQEIGYLKRSQELHQQDIEKLGERWRELQVEVALLKIQKTKPAKK